MDAVEVPLWLQCFFEFLGTFVMILLGCGVCACTSLNKSKGFGSGWVVVTIAWGLAVTCGVLIAGPYTGAHLNPAVTVGLATAGKFAWAAVVPYIVAQVAGAFVAALLVYLFYKDQFDRTEGQDSKLGVFCTIPAVYNPPLNFLSEVVGTFVLILVILMMTVKGNTAEIGLGSIGAIPVGLLVIVIGMSLGGTTGYAINPARDFGPRLAHAVLPIKGKGSSQWYYSWVPIVGPIVGSLCAVIVYYLLVVVFHLP